MILIKIMKLKMKMLELIIKNNEDEYKDEGYSK